MFVFSLIGLLGIEKEGENTSFVKKTSSVNERLYVSQGNSLWLKIESL